MFLLVVSNLGVAHSCMTVPDAAPVLDTCRPVRGLEVQASKTQSRTTFNHCVCEDIPTVAKVVEAGCLPTKGPSWGHPSPVLGAVAPFLSTFGENRLRFLKHLSKLTFEYPHEGPCVGWGFGARGRPRAMRLNCNSSPQKCQSIALGATQFTTQMLCHQE